MHKSTMFYAASEHLLSAKQVFAVITVQLSLQNETKEKQLVTAVLVIERVYST